MAARWIPIQVAAIFLTLNVVKSSHFQGATIHWRPVNPQDFDGMIEFRHQFTWSMATSSCNANDIGTFVLVGDSGSFSCRSGCSGTIANTRVYCTDYDVPDNWLIGERTTIYNIGTQTDIGNFEASHASCCWVPGNSWEIRVKGNVAPRPDTGLINSSPVTTATPLRLQAGCSHTIRIPVRDADGDIVRCRRAVWTEECSGACDGLPGALLNQDSCVITWTASDTAGTYPVALQVEDFRTSQESISMSSVPLQFLVRVFTSSETCTGGIRPSLVSGETPADGSCIAVPINTTYRAGIVATSGSTSVSINRFVTSSPFGLVTSAVTQSIYTSTYYYTNVTWTPSTSQFGLNLFCFRAVSSNDFETDQSCITLLPGVPTALSGSASPTGTFSPTPSTTWSITFDQPITRPTSTRFIIFYETLSRQNVYSVDVRSSTVTYPVAGSGGRTLTFSGVNYNFADGQDYYVLLDNGVATGGFCNNDSQSVTSRSFWTFSTVPLSVELRIAASNLTQLESTTVECNVSGAVPSLTLRRNGQLLTQVNEDHLTFTTSPQSYGTYTCAAGGLQSSAILQEQVPFQLLLNEISTTQCQDLMNQTVDFEQAVLATLNDLCQSCENLTLDNIAESYLNCSVSGASVYFSATLIYSSPDGQFTATSLVNTLITRLLSEQSPALVLDGASFVLSQQCLPSLNAITEEACVNALNTIAVTTTSLLTDNALNTIAVTTTPPLTDIDTTQPDPAAGPSVQGWLVAVCLLAGLFAGIAIAVCLILCIKKARCCATETSIAETEDRNVEMKMNTNQAYTTVDTRYHHHDPTQIVEESVIYDIPAI